MVPKGELDRLSLGLLAIGVGGAAQGFRLTGSTTVPLGTVVAEEIPGSAVRPREGLHKVGLLLPVRSAPTLGFESRGTRPMSLRRSRLRPIGGARG